MQTFESGGALLVKPRRRLRALLRAGAMTAAALTLSPALVFYFLMVA